MQTLDSLRRQIDTATDLGSVVSTMKTLAAVSIRQYEQAVESLDDFSRVIDLGFQMVLRDQTMTTHSQVSATGIGAVVFGTDQGMCGRFNEEIVTFVQQQRDAVVGPDWPLLVVGRRVEEQLLEARLSVAKTYPVPTSVTEITGLVQELLPQVERWQAEADLARFWVIHNRRTSASTFQPERTQMLPIDPGRAKQWREQPWPSRSLPAFTMNRRQLLSRLVRQHLFVSLFRACTESLASENASRIAAMQAAEKNIEDRLEDLQGVYNHLRQTAITEELLDVVTGFEALASDDTSSANVSFGTET